MAAIKSYDDFVLLFLLAVTVSAQTPDSGPSFSCAHVTSQVNQLICASPSLSALDRELANVFNNTLGQAAFQREQGRLQSDEHAWLAAMLRDCKNASCIESHYKARIAELREQSLRAASPAAYDETRPFPAPAALFAEAQSLIGKACSYQPSVVGPIIPGFKPAARFLPVIAPIGAAVVREKQGLRFAFLVSSGDSECHILDVVTLPASAVGDRFLQCAATDLQLNGFGVRNAATHALDGFWAVNPTTRRLDRVPMGVLGIQKSVRCQQPETGE